MFERFSEKARRIIFFARYEASQFGSPSVNTEHMLLGLFREDKTLLRGLLGPDTDLSQIAESFRETLPKADPTSTSVDLPLSETVRAAMSLALEEVERTNQRVVAPVHLLLGVMRADQTIASFLESRSITVDAVRLHAVTAVPMANITFERKSRSAIEVITALRAEFFPLTKKLTLEVEPALKYRLTRPQAEHENK